MIRVCRRLAIAARGLAAWAVAVAPAGARSLRQIEESGSIRIATANEIPYGCMTPDGKAAGIALTSRTAAALPWRPGFGRSSGRDSRPIRFLGEPDDAVPTGRHGPATYRDRLLDHDARPTPDDGYRTRPQWWMVKDL
jgi:hypothetical protein